jgi:DNA-binding NarL/FixJ family response regulator
MTPGVPKQAEEAEQTSVLVVDDHRTFSDLLALVLSDQPDLRCVGTAHTVEEGLALADALHPDVVVMDVRIGDGDGVAATAELVARHPQLRVVVLTAHATQDLLERVGAAGACALLPKDGALSEMLTALRTSRRNALVVHPMLLKSLVANRREPPPYVPALTSRERDVLRMLAEGRDTRAISRHLDISLNTCRGYVRGLLSKLDAHSQLEAVAIAKRHGLIDGDDRD